MREISAIIAHPVSRLRPGIDGIDWIADVSHIGYPVHTVNHVTAATFWSAWYEMAMTMMSFSASSCCELIMT